LKARESFLENISENGDQIDVLKGKTKEYYNKKSEATRNRSQVNW